MAVDPKELLVQLMQAATSQDNQPHYQDITIIREGSKIVMPPGMTHKEAIRWHQRMMEEEEEVIGIHEEINAYPLDGAMALMKALKERFGWTSLVPTPGFFGSRPPQMIGVEVDFGQTVQVPWGRVQIPGMSGYLVSNVKYREGRALFCIQGETQMRHKELVHMIAEDVRRIVETDSIYRGKAIRIEFPANMDDDEEGNFDPTEQMPRFIDIHKVRPEELIFSAATERVLDTTLWTPIEKTELCRQAGIPLKRGILLEGPFGTGKTLAANVTARKAVQHRWTFIYLEDIKQLDQAMMFAQMYQPAVIFAEDIDRVDEYGNRNEQMNNILNTIDGIGYKHNEIITVLTTNHVERITQAMLRPGRLDAVIGVRAPDQEAVERLIRLYARNMLRADENITEVAAKLKGQIPATIREVVERSKLAAIRRGDLDYITADDLAIAADGMMHHLKLLEEKKEDTRSDMEKAADIVAKAISPFPVAS